MGANWTLGFERDGFALVPEVADEDLLAVIDQEIAALEAGPSARERAGSTYALRNVLADSPRLLQLAAGGPFLALAQAALGPEARGVRGILFDKTPEANWKVAWHQDRTIAVRERIELPGFGPWSVKLGVAHVEPPREILEQMVALRIHLDDCPAENGALRLSPGSHRRGKLDPQEIARLAESGLEEITCPARRGEILVMRPLVLHASRPSSSPARRRVLHLEYAGGELPGGLAWRVC